MNAFEATATVAAGAEHSLRMSQVKRWPGSRKIGGRHDPEELTQATIVRWNLMSIQFVQMFFEPSTAMTFLDFYF